ncbi:MAG: RelA/SpoT family protein [Pseudoflavonifractor sp.]|nr:RelA/SpoT family protein [Alloprevotella sp.]MCM1116659.1 RelA/SpoT family protein [Pseudoflavonifractor sp.]
MRQYTVSDKSSASIPALCRDIMRRCRAVERPADFAKLRRVMESHAEALRAANVLRFEGIDPVGHALATARALCEGISPDRSMALAILLAEPCKADLMEISAVEAEWGDDIGRLVRGLVKVSSLYGHHAAATDAENFRRLLLTFAEDIRVIIIMIVERLILMRAINHHPDDEAVRQVACEAGYLYAPLAHRLGLYAIKSELEDMSLKYTNRDIYTRIAHKLAQTKAKRDEYISAFIAPVKAALEAEGLTFDIKGRTKSIYSIWNKMQKQHVDLEGIYDLFAIRIIIDTPERREKPDCWMAYSVVTDMYQPNPARLKDWLSIPKSNGYESLHITVKGPEQRWVEVQIRTRRMDEIAEKGIAAHWKYKGIKSENNLDTWMNHVREILETADSGPTELMKNMSLDMYAKEVFVFTPKGDLFRLPQGATLLDFAFNIHSGLGSTCTGGKVNGRTRRLNYKLRSGDTVEIMTSAQQQPKADWLSFVVTSKARNKIRQSLNERARRAADLGRELLQRRLKNRKIEIDEPTLMRIMKKLGFKTVTDFFVAISDQTLDINRIVAEYDAIIKQDTADETATSAEAFTLQQPSQEQTDSSDDILVIGDDIKGVNYRLARCCNPIYGDQVFGFISSEGVIKIHRTDCPNAANIRARYPYRMISTRWSGKVGQQFAATLRVVGHDDIGIVTNITSIINKESGSTLRDISISSHAGIFNGYLVVGVPTTEALNNIMKKIKTVKGVKDVQRSN